MQLAFRNKGLRKYAETGQSGGIPAGTESAVTYWIAELSNAQSIADIKTGVEQVGKHLGARDTWSIQVNKKWKLLFHYNPDEKYCCEIDLVQGDKVTSRIGTYKRTNLRVSPAFSPIAQAIRAIPQETDPESPQSQGMAAIFWEQPPEPSVEPPELGQKEEPAESTGEPAQSEQTPGSADSKAKAFLYGLPQDKLPIPKIFGSMRMFYRGNQKLLPKPIIEPTELPSSVQNARVIFEGQVLSTWDLEVWAELAALTRGCYFGELAAFQLNALKCTQERWARKNSKSSLEDYLSKSLDRLQSAQAFIKVNGRVLMNGPFLSDYTISGGTILFQIGRHCEPLLEPENVSVLDWNEAASKIQSEPLYRLYLALLCAGDEEPHTIPLKMLHLLCSSSDTPYKGWWDHYWDRLSEMMSLGLIREAWTYKGNLSAWLTREVTADERRGFRSGVHSIPNNNGPMFNFAYLDNGKIVSPDPRTGRLHVQIMRLLHPNLTDEEAQETAEKKSAKPKKDAQITNRENQKQTRSSSLLRAAALDSEEARAEHQEAIRKANNEETAKQIAEWEEATEKLNATKAEMKNHETSVRQAGAHPQIDTRPQPADVPTEERFSISQLKDLSDRGELISFFKDRGITVQTGQADGKLPTPEPEIPGNKIAQRLLELNGFKLNEGLNFLNERPDLWAMAYLAGIVPNENYTFDDLMKILKGDPITRSRLPYCADALCLRRARMIAQILDLAAPEKLTQNESELLAALEESGMSRIEQARALLNAPTSAARKEILSGAFTPSLTERGWINEFLLEDFILGSASQNEIRNTTAFLSSIMEKAPMFSMRAYIVMKRARSIYSDSSEI